LTFFQSLSEKEVKGYIADRKRYCQIITHNITSQRSVTLFVIDEKQHGEKVTDALKAMVETFKISSFVEIKSIQINESRVRNSFSFRGNKSLIAHSFSISLQICSQNDISGAVNDAIEESICLEVESSNRMSIIALPFTIYEDSIEEINTAVERAGEEDIVVFAAAGNQGKPVVVASEDKPTYLPGSLICCSFNK